MYKKIIPECQSEALSLFGDAAGSALRVVVQAFGVPHS
jgi:hypothetical protein